MAAISPTRLNTFETCGRQYEAKYITREVQFKQNNHALFGDLIHKALEKFILTGQKLPKRVEIMGPILEKHKDKLVSAERTVAITRDHKACGPKSKKAWLSSKVDAVYASPNGKNILAFDWKTGKVSDAQIQSDITKLCLAGNFPDAEKITVVFVHLFHDGLVVDPYRPGVDRLSIIYGQILELEDADKDKHYEANPSGLCGKWCDVLSCPHNGKNK